MSMGNIKTDLVVIGAGAAGLMCAATASGRGLGVVAIDPNREPGRKLRITGKGRCNLTNNCSVQDLMENIPGDGRFLYSSVNAFTMQDVMSFFEENGLPLKTERGNRVFPVSDNANDVADLLVEICRKNGVKFIRGSADKIIAEDGAVKAVSSSEGIIECANVALCTGGMSYPLTGSDGRGYKLAKTLGHSVIRPRPSLVPLVSPDPYCAELQGFAPRNVVLRAYEDNKLIYREMGEMLFTHFGVSGPLVLSASAHMRSFDSCAYRLEIDMKPALDERKLDARILRDFGENTNRQIKNVLPGLTGASMAPVVAGLAKIDGDKPVNSVTREERNALIKILKAFPVNISGTRPIDEAIITAGGVNTKEVNPRTMESRLVKGLYFAGEILNLDAYTGGFNLQIAWSTGRAAGSAVKKG